MGLLGNESLTPCVYFQAVLKNTIASYDEVGVLPKPETKQLELRLIQSVKEIQSPVIKFFTEKL